MSLNKSYGTVPDTASPQELGLRKALFLAEDARTRLREFAVNLRALRASGDRKGWHPSKTQEMYKLAFALQRAEREVESCRWDMADWTRRGRP